MNPPHAAPTDIQVNGLPVRRTTPDVTGALVQFDGEAYYRITDVDAMAPFLMSLLSDSDHWLFVSSTGALTAGRRDPHHAVFPYYTDDRIHDGRDDTGTVTVLLVHTDGGRQLWEPFTDRHRGAYRLSRNLYKNTVGTTVRFEEINHDLGLTFTWSWAPSERFGFVRRVRLANTGARPVTVEVLDGVRNIIPAGTDRFFQEHFSTLVDGHKHSELDPATGLGLYTLTSIPGDSAKPGEALRAAVAWSHGLPEPVHHLDAAALADFRHGVDAPAAGQMRGRRGAHLTRATVTVEAGGAFDWRTAVDTGLDAAAAIRLRRFLAAGGDIAAEVDADARRTTEALTAIVGTSDGLQTTGDQLSAARHFSNVLFNVMRGGMPDDGYTVGRDDVVAYLRTASPRVFRRQRDRLAALPDRLPYADLLADAADSGDVEWERLAYEFLPFTFSRRHGDPSRPWNNFAIAVKDADGRKVLGYQGNWRDIFQNWEALAYSFPEYVESMVFRFVNASTADGNNPYRITQTGIEWEQLDENDPHSHVGYWGDHQVIYLLKLLETSALFHPGRLTGLLGRRLFTYADVPYRIRPYADLLDNPRDTIEFDAAKDADLRRRMAGDQGPFLLGADGEPLKVTLAEKLLVVALGKLGSFLPEAGIWMNTQRPEWNDANNALVGYGVSMVTLYQLRRYLTFCRDLLSGAELTVEVATLLRRVAEVFTAHEHLLGGPISDTDRRRVLDALGTAAADYRATLYAGGLTDATVTVDAAELDAFFATALRHLDHTIRANKRPDGLYHSYNLLRVDGDGIAVRRLYEMLEGQVAVLGSGALTGAEAADLLDALRASAMYRSDQNSYTLYPDRQLPGFLEKNVVPPAVLDRSKLLAALVNRGDRRIIVRDDEGGLHFNASFRNAEHLATALGTLADDAELAELVAADRQVVLDAYEEVFDHQSFTGRSGTLYKYEGLGCIYWHMVSKLLLGIGEAIALGGDDATVTRLKSHYEQVRDGIGVHKAPGVHGAVPLDPYSHTPGFTGAQQPGMTGQVKEDVIGRIGELGLTVTDGRMVFRPDLVRPAEFRAEPGTLSYVDPTGARRTLDVPANGYAFTFCQVPIVVRRGGPAAVTATVDGAERTGGLALDAQTSAAVFARTGAVTRLDVTLP